MSVSVKICGLSTPEAIGAAARHGARYVGFVFFPPSPRHVDIGQAASLATMTSPQVGRIGVFVDPDDDLVSRAVRDAGLDAIQLHKASPDRVAALRRLSGVQAWAAVAVKARGDLDLAHCYVGAADRILYDAKTPDDAALPGGMGLRFDWSLLDGFRHPLPWALSGGLDAGNVADAVRQTGATLVDVSSGVESAPGVKSVDKIAAFLKAAGS